ncbi:MAG: hypothetical protein ACTHMG_00190 [Sphingomonas sp.]
MLVFDCKDFCPPFAIAVHIILDEDLRQREPSTRSYRSMRLSRQHI